MHGLFPLHRERFSCSHLQGQLIGMNSVADQCLARFSARARALIAQRIAQVVLGRGPLLGKLRVGPDG